MIKLNKKLETRISLLGGNVHITGNYVSTDACNTWTLTHANLEIIVKISMINL